MKEAAVKEGATLRLATPVISIDPDGGSITTNDGSVIHADVIVGADGVHSVSRGQIAGPDHKPFGSGKSAFRFLIPRQSVLEDPQTRPYAECDGELVMVYHKDRRLVMYPTNDNTLLNLVCIHPEAETASTSSGDWNNNATKEMLFRVYDEFHEDFKSILNKVDESSLKIWRLLDMVSQNHCIENKSNKQTGSPSILDERALSPPRRRSTSFPAASRAGRSGGSGRCYYARCRS